MLFRSVINQIVGNQAGIKFLPGKRSEGDPEKRQPDISRANEILGWEPWTRLEEGLSRTIDYFREVLAL